MQKNPSMQPILESPDIETMLESVRKYIISNINTYDPTLRKMALYFANNQGKMLRPTLTLTCGLIGGSENVKMDELYMAAAGVEMLHMSALLHDDILDKAKTRRGQPSVNALYGQDKALLLGDYFYSRALHILSRLSHKSILEKAIKVIAQMVEGEIKQQRQTFDITTQIKDYLTIISCKTASLTSFSCFAGARIANLTEEQIRRLVKMGLNLGRAYQIRDDILDFLNKEDYMKKPASDMEQGIITLPLILLIKKISNTEDLETYDIKHFLKFPLDPLLKIDAAGEAAQYANYLLSEAIESLRFFPPCNIKLKLLQVLNKVLINEILIQ